MIDKSKLQYAFIVIMITLLIVLTACAPTDFAEVDSSVAPVSGTGAEVDNGSGGNSNGSGNANGGETEVPVMGSQPKVEIRIPSNCVARAVCPVYSILTVSTGQSVSFDWATNDTAYTRDPAVIAEPNRHYVPTGGLIQLTESQNKQDMPIQALSNFTRILIPFRWMNCKLDGVNTSCANIEFAAIAL